MAYAGGWFGGSRLAALDAAGAVVAWDGQRGLAEAVTACPDGGPVVALGRDERSVDRELSWHAPATLRPERTVEPQMGSVQPLALRCADAAGRVELIVAGENFARLITLDGDEERSTSLGAVGAAAVVPGGLVGVVAGEGGGRPVLVRISDGEVRTLREIDDLDRVDELAASPDGATVALSGHRDGGRDQLVRTYDLRTAEQLGEWPGADRSGALAWTSTGRLLVRAEAGRNAASAPLTSFDRTLRDPVARPSVPRGWLAAVGTSAVAYGGGGVPLTLVGEAGKPVAAGDLRLAQTLAFATPPVDGAPTGAGRDRSWPLLLALVAAAGAGAVVLVRRLGHRRRA